MRIRIGQNDARALRRAVLLASVCAMALAARPAATQTLERVSREGFNPQTLAPEPRMQRGEIDVTREHAAPASRRKGGAGLVRQVRVTGGYPVFAQETARIAHGLEGRRVTQADLDAAAAAVRALYTGAGYPLVRVDASADFRRQTAQIAVVDGYIAAIDVSGVPERERALALGRLQPLVGRRGLAQAEFDRRVLLLGDIAGLVGAVALKPGAAPGASILVVSAKHSMVLAAAGVDNRLPNRLGNIEFFKSLAINNALGWGEQFQVDVSSGRNIDRYFDGAAKFQTLSGAFSLPIGFDGLVLNASYTSVRTRPNTPAGLFVNPDEYLSTSFERFNIRATYPLLLTARNVVRIQGGFYHIEGRQRGGPAPLLIDAFGQPIFDFYRDRYNSLRLAGEWITRAPWSSDATIATALFYTRGIGGRANTIFDATALSRPGASPDFDKLKLDLKLSQPLPGDARLAFFAKAQTGFGRPLMLPEQLNLDGADAVSGFSAGSLNVDRGFNARLEVSRPLAFQTGAGAGVVTPYLFAAMGRGVLEQPLFGEKRVIAAESLGGGLRAQARLFGGPFEETASVELAKTFSNLPYQGSGFRANFVYAMKYDGSPFAPLFARATGAQTRAAQSAFSGFYAGVNVGAALDGSRGPALAATPLVNALDAGLGAPYASASAASLAGRGAGGPASVAGVQFGRNIRVGGAVLGLEGDFQSLGAHRAQASGAGVATSGGLSDVALGRIASEKSVAWLGTARARAGYLLTPTLLAYGSAGLAFGKTNAHVAAAQAWAGALSAPIMRSSGMLIDGGGWRAGWTAGAGLEWLFARQASLKGEYLYYDLGSGQAGGVFANQAAGLSNVLVAQARTRFNGHIFRVGLNYQFDAADIGTERPRFVKGADQSWTPHWAGAYAGLSAGRMWNVRPGEDYRAAPGANALDVALARPVTVISALAATGFGHSPVNGAFGGAQIGYNVKSGSFVGGLEADFSGSNARGQGVGASSAQAAGDTTATLVVDSRRTIDWLASARVRAGYLANPTLLAYATAGAAFAGLSTQQAYFQQWTGAVGGAIVSPPALASLSRTAAGWTLGAGLEWMISPDVSVKAEYGYYRFGARANAPVALVSSFGVASAALVASRGSFDEQIARIGLNYHFGSIAP
ncbi:MAG: outer membrane beta-barrel protein [Hyphomicrobiales bacterium]|nr:outer membrane beta-barrel protein [Hyphomicrobiales bacterium]